MLLDFLILFCCLLLLFGYVMNIVKIFNENENSKTKTFRIVFTFVMPIVASIIGFMNFPIDEKDVAKKVTNNKKVKTVKKTVKNKKIK